MSNGIDIKFVKQAYQGMGDDELIRIATGDAYGLTPEAMEVVKEEIRKRGLDESIIKGVELQNKELALEEIDAYCDVISKLSCPVCGISSERLNATMTSEVMSFIFFTQLKRKIKIACGHCLDKANENALIKSAVLGWWGIPWGIIRTPEKGFQQSHPPYGEISWLFRIILRATRITPESFQCTRWKNKLPKMT